MAAVVLSVSVVAVLVVVVLGVGTRRTRVQVLANVCLVHMSAMPSCPTFFCRKCSLTRSARSTSLAQSSADILSVSRSTTANTAPRVALGSYHAFTNTKGIVFLLKLLM